MKKILVTGSLGYLGSALTQDLAEHGFGVVGYDTGFFKDCTLYPPAPTETVMKDARDITEADLEGIDAVVHLAGISNDPFGDLDASMVYDPTRVYAKAIAGMCKKKGIRFVFASSCSVYGKSEGGILDEDAPTVPQTPYSKNKLEVEGDLRELAADGTFSPIALRFATAFGASPRMRFDIVINMLAGMAASSGTIVLNSDGSAWRPNVHVLDICQAIRYAVDSDWKGGLLVLNVGDERNNMRIIDIAKLVQSKVPGCEIKFLSENAGLDKEGLIRDRNVNVTDTRTYQVSFDRIKKTFPGFGCAWTIDAGTDNMIAKLKEIGFTEKEFKNINYYRLKKISSLYADQYLSRDLRWLKAH